MGLHSDGLYHRVTKNRSEKLINLLGGLLTEAEVKATTSAGPIAPFVITLTCEPGAFKAIHGCTYSTEFFEYVLLTRNFLLVQLSNSEFAKVF